MAADAVRRRRRDRVRHRALHVAQCRDEPVPPAARARARGHRPTDLVRPAVPQGVTPAPVADLLAAIDRQDRAVDAGLLRRAHRFDARPGCRRCRRRVRAAHPGARDRDHARPSGERRGQVPRLRQPRARRCRPAARAAGRGDDGAVRVPDGSHRRSHRQPARRPDHLPAQQRDGRQEARPLHSRAHDRVAAHRRHRHDVERDRRFALAPGRPSSRIASGSSPTATSSPSPWRSSCAPTRR